MSDAAGKDAGFDLADLMEKAFLMGIGALEVTREKTADFANDLIERGRMSQSEAKQVAERISTAAEKQREVIRETVAREADRAMRASHLATREDLERLAAEVAELKELVEKLAGAAGSSD